MTENYEPRLFADDIAVRRAGEGLIARTLPRADWTHEAHLAACLYIIAERHDMLPERDLPALIRRYNESVGGVNDDTEGYHETGGLRLQKGIGANLALLRPHCSSGL